MIKTIKTLNKFSIKVFFKPKPQTSRFCMIIKSLFSQYFKAEKEVKGTWSQVFATV